MVIGAAGLEAASPITAELGPKLVSSERLSTGVPALDVMFKGGYYRGSSILVTGAPGTAKSTLSGAFAEAACVRGEPTLFVSFDSDSLEIVRNLSSVGIKLGRFQKSGLLQMHSSRGNFRSAEVHLLGITCLARDHGVRCLVIDPVSALAKAGSDFAGFSVVERLIDWAKHRGITVLCTSLLDSSGVDAESTPMQISTIADTWLHLSYVVNAGERNRALTIIKSRGTAHSNQVRELILSDAGITLAEVYTAEGQVLMGTMRWQKERAEEAARQKARSEMKRHERTALAEQQELAVRLAVLQRELQAKDAELALLRETQAGQAVAEVDRRDEMYARRAGAKGDPKAKAPRAPRVAA
ncbi:MAG: hypothetical protein EOO23_07290 [Comamonadaceae bacterium]|nr:MAG: hypothetical protein EOO23_07290 [Comamonadaceae bacterium]